MYNKDNIQILKNIEKEVIEEVLIETCGHREEAAWILGINKTYLYKKLKEYGILKTKKII